MGKQHHRHRREDARGRKETFVRRISLDGFIDEVHAPAECAEVYTRLAKDASFPVVQFDWDRL